jgi:TATA-box binding protein (TBP) (component of TFIID and TFIIIB)
MESGFGETHHVCEGRVPSEATGFLDWLGEISALRDIGTFISKLEGRITHREPFLLEVPVSLEKRPKLRIVNLVATADLGRPVNLGRLKGRAGFAYDSSVYHCAYFKDENTKGKVSIFSTGKMISIGTKAFKDAKFDLNYVSEKLADLRITHSAVVEAKLQNICAVSEAGILLDIERISQELSSGRIIYEPEQFPGAILWAPELEGGSVLLFPSGKLFFAGLRSRTMMRSAEEFILRLRKEVSHMLQYPS